MRARHEHQIKLFGRISGPKFEDALTYLAFQHGFDWFTDDQIAEIRAEMIECEWFRHKLNRENRKERAS